MEYCFTRRHGFAHMIFISDLLQPSIKNIQSQSPNPCQKHSALIRTMRRILYLGSVRRLRNVVCIAITATLLSCSTTTGTKTSLAPSELSKLRKVGILVESGTPFSVRIARDKLTNTGAVLFGLIGAGIEAGYKASKDTDYENEMNHFLGDFDPVKDSATALHQKFSVGKVFQAVEGVQTENARVLKEQGFDSVLKETIEEWGLRLCSGEENVQVGFDINAQLVLLQNNTKVWERDELFMEGPCRPLSDFRADKELLGATLRRATENLAGRIVNDIAFP